MSDTGLDIRLFASAKSCIASFLGPGVWRLRGHCILVRKRAERDRSAPGMSTMSNVSSDTPRSIGRKPVRTSIKLAANAARAALGLRDEEQAFELPGRLFE